MSALRQPRTNPLNTPGVRSRPDSRHGTGRLSFGHGPSLRRPFGSARGRPLRLRSGQARRVGFARNDGHCPGFRYVYFTSAMLRGQTIGWRRPAPAYSASMVLTFGSWLLQRIDEVARARGLGGAAIRRIDVIIRVGRDPAPAAD